MTYTTTFMSHNGHQILITLTASRLGKYQRKRASCRRCGTWYEANTTNWQEPIIDNAHFDRPCNPQRVHTNCLCGAQNTWHDATQWDDLTDTTQGGLLAWCQICGHRVEEIERA